jgi:hypothetical protein
MTRPRRRRTGTLTTFAALAALPLSVLVAAPTSATSTSTGTLTVVATGLDNPRGLALGRHGTLYVGEAGHAGSVCLGAGEIGPECLGQTSQIGAIDLKTGKHRTVVGGLLSVGSAVGSTGVDGIAYRNGTLVGIMTGSPQGLPDNPCKGNPDVKACNRAVARAKAKLGDLIRVRDHKAKSIAEVGRFNYDWIVDHKASLGAVGNPDFQPGDSNPYGVAAVKGGWYVVDAGSNTLNFVSHHGHVSVVTADNGKPVYFPDPPGDPKTRFPYDDVPTCVVARRGTVWVGSLAGRVWKFDGHKVTLVADRSDGLTAISGCALDSNGDLWLSNIFGATPETTFTPNSGSIVRLHGGTVRKIATGVNFPAGIAIESAHGHQAGRVFVAVNSVCPKDLSLVGPKDPPFCTSTGSVVRVAR